MADAPWRCSACGTINEPVANSCRTCGRWPSLFDLQDSLVDEIDPEDVAESTLPEELYPEPMSAEPPPLEPEPFEVDPLEPKTAPEPAPSRRGMFDPPTTDPVLEQDEGSRRTRWARWLVPLGFVLYLVISLVFGDR